MTINKFCAAVVAASTLCASAAFAGDYTSGNLFVRKNLCEPSKQKLVDWAIKKKRWTAYTMTITSEQAAADCYDFSSENKIYLAATNHARYLAKKSALEACVIANPRDWCVVIGLVTAR